MNWDRLLAFYYTATLGSTRKASEKLGMTGSAVTRSIKKLEEEIGHELFSVVQQRLTLNKKGEIFLQSAKNILFQYELSLKKLNDASDKMEGHFGLSLPSFISNLWFFEDMSNFIETHPQLTFSFKNLNEAPDFTLGEINIDIRPVTKKEENIDYKYLTTYDIGLYASRDYLQKKGFLERVTDFHDHHLISYTKDCLFPYAPINWYLTHIPQWKQLTIIECPTDIFRAIENGIGIGPLSHAAVQTSRVPLVPILPAVLSQSIDIYYMYPKTLAENKVIAGLYEYLRERPEGPLKGRMRM